jgi:MYXO-CTERM domain-containing protein
VQTDAPIGADHLVLPDAPVPPHDAGHDARPADAAPPADAVAPDDASTTDALADDAAPAPDANGSVASRGCACATGGRDPSPAWLVLGLGALGLVGRGARRRPRRR